jgi:hypothetical protein
MRIRSALLFVPFLVAIVVPACNANSEGQPCDRNAGDSRNTGFPGSDDCQSPLVCRSAPNPASTGYRCCPATLSQATTFDCSVGMLNFDASPVPPDASSRSDGPAESAPAPDAPGEAAPTSDASDATMPGDASDATSPPDASEAAAPADGAAE